MSSCLVAIWLNLKRVYLPKFSELKAKKYHFSAPQEVIYLIFLVLKWFEKLGQKPNVRLRAHCVGGGLKFFL